MRWFQYTTPATVTALLACFFLANAAHGQSSALIENAIARPMAIPATNYYYAYGAFLPPSSGEVMSYHISSTPTYIPPSPNVPTSIAPTPPSVPTSPPPPSAVPPAPPSPEASPAPTQVKGSNFVTITDEAYTPNTLIIAKGATVRWINAGKEKHTVTSDKGLWDSGDIDPGAAYSVTFTQAGTYQYHCNNHKGMTGSIVVQE
jgi:plastocyanin